MTNVEGDQVNASRRQITTRCQDTDGIHPGFDQLLASATTNSKLGHFNDAMNDANSAIKLNPRGFKGYVVASEVYLMQGKADLAADVLAQCLRNMSPYDPHYQTLVSFKEAAEIQNSKGIDFTKLLPVEIVSNIFVRAGGIESLVVLLMVSKAWRMLVLELPDLWRTCTAPLKLDEDAKICDALTVVAGKHVKSFNLRSHPSVICLRYLDHMERGTFSRLSSLSVEDGVTSLVSGGRLSEILRQLKSTLKELDISFSNGREEMLYVTDILALCPGLTALKYAAAQGTVESSTDRLEPAQPHNLAKLRITSSGNNHTISDSGLRLVLRRCPLLRLINLNRSSLDFLAAIEETCPHIEYITMQHSLTPEMFDIKFAKDPAGGIIALNLMGGTDILDSLIPFLNRHKDTLQELEAPNAMIHNTIPLSHSSPIDPIRLPALQSIGCWISETDPGTERTLTNIIRHSPLLEEVWLANGAASEDTISALKDLDHLEILGLHYIDVVQNDGALYALLDKHIQLGHRSPLRHFSAIGRMTRHFFSKLSKVETLREIGLWEADISTDEIVLLQFVKNLEVLPYLESVTLSFNAARTCDEVLEIVGKINRKRR
ncbi:hypothetical protein BJV82DRAFT_631226 [Fennellomyces sp. T-0311]|nr:hypothetical protein BJV82DRAFT_631226 [Fennellomyces sp. T-0311]